MKLHRRLYLWLSHIFERMALFVLWIADGEMYERPMTRLQLQIDATAQRDNTLK